MPNVSHETHRVDVPGVGLVRAIVAHHRDASGHVYLSMLQDARSLVGTTLTGDDLDYVRSALGVS